MDDRTVTRRREALDLADELLRNIELGELAPADIARKASRLARLLDDQDAMQWLRFEVEGYPADLDSVAYAAGERSNRHADAGRVFTGSLAYLQSEVDTASAQLNAPAGALEGDWAFRVEMDRRAERQALRQLAAHRKALIDKILSAIHLHVSARYQELRFGAAVETAFEVVREQVDGAIGALVPDALPMLSAAFENAASDKPEHWANAASTCRRLLKLAADQLRPPCDDLQLPGRKSVKMGPDNYVNRLATWISDQTNSETGERMLVADLEYLGARLDAADGAGQKGAHAIAVTREEASRYITGTYLLLGDILALQRDAGRNGVPPGDPGAERSV